MFIELIATLLAGLAGAGVVMLLNKVLGGRLPRWFAPVGAGLAMLATTISNEYSWFDRTKETMPEAFQIAETVENKTFYRPWTYAFPYVHRYVAVDEASVRTHANHPGLKLADIYFFGRWSPVNRLPILADCPQMRRAALADGIDFDQSGTIGGVDWVQVDSSDALVATLCGAG
jgi:hypothetical protein